MMLFESLRSCAYNNPQRRARACAAAVIFLRLGVGTLHQVTQRLAKARPLIVIALLYIICMQFKYNLLLQIRRYTSIPLILSAN
ncbi:hypothetical protein V1508DRAFT_408602 [Lipomyces doorenjongii]|uniref:uncharacterized protein n=1 Tax=Lipomyces doorenjongii TaxID=383834 RepID=UPI0034CE4B1A